MRRIRFTRFGVFYILFSIAVGAAAINTGNNLLYLMLGLLLGFILISGVLSDSCLWGLTMDLEPVGDLYAGRAAEFELGAHKTWFPGVVVQVDTLWKTGQTAHALFYWIGRRNSATTRFHLTPSKRGWLELRELVYATGFPFGLFEKVRRQARDDRWIVFPPVQLLSLQGLRAAGLSWLDRPSGRKGLGATPWDLREYRQGDSSKRIHWKSSAKRGQLMVAEMEEESAASPQVRVFAWPDDPEPFIAFLASLAYTMFSLGLRMALHTPARAFAPVATAAELKQILTYLALVDPAAEAHLAGKGTAESSRAIDAVQLWRKYG